MELNNTKIKQLNEALLSAYPFLHGLKRLVRFRMEENLEDIAPGNSLPETVTNLTKWAVEQGRLDELIQQAYQANPANRQLYDFVQQYQKEKEEDEPGYK